MSLADLGADGKGVQLSLGSNANYGQSGVISPMESQPAPPAFPQADLADDGMGFTFPQISGISEPRRFFTHPWNQFALAQIRATSFSL